jgi:hypothetical protein
MPVLREISPVWVSEGELEHEFRGNHASNAIDNFCFDVTLSYRRLERPRRAEVRR